MLCDHRADASSFCEARGCSHTTIAISFGSLKRKLHASHVHTAWRPVDTSLGLLAINEWRSGRRELSDGVCRAR